MEMLEFIVLFSIKSALVLTVLWLPYALLLRREKFFRFNRIMLLAIIVLSFLIPLLDVPALRIETSSNGVIEFGMPQALMEMQEGFRKAFLLPEVVVSAAEQRSAFNWQLTLALVYIIGVAVALFYRLRSYIRMRRFISSGCLWTDNLDGDTLYCHAASVVPFSWMHFIVISESDYEQNGRTILLHEKAHIRLHHSYDVLLVQFMKILQWFNPCIYLLEMDLRDVHEFQADDAVLSSGITAHSYQLLLIKKAVGSSSYTFANSFNHSLLKKRITMMLQKKSSPWRMARALYLAPCVVLLALLFATPQLSSCTSNDGKGTNNSENDSTNVEGIAISVSTNDAPPPVVLDSENEEQADANASSDAASSSTDDNDANDDVLDVVEEMPAFSGGMEALMKFLQNNVKYPKESQEKGEQGRVLVEFVVEKDGRVTSPKVVKSVSPQLDAEALRVVKMMPQWEPGKQNGKEVRVKYAIPVVFRLN